MQHFDLFLCVKSMPIRSKHSYCWCRHAMNALAYEGFHIGSHIFLITLSKYSEKDRFYATISGQLKMAGYQSFQFQLIFRFWYSNCFNNFPEPIKASSFVWNFIHVMNLNFSDICFWWPIKLFLTDTSWCLPEILYVPFSRYWHLVATVLLNVSAYPPIRLDRRNMLVDIIKCAKFYFPADKRTCRKLSHLEISYQWIVIVKEVSMVSVYRHGTYTDTVRPTMR